MKIRIMTLLLLLIGMAFAAEAGADETAFVKVGLKYGSTAVKEADFKSDYGLNFYNAVTGELLYTSAAGESVEVKKSGGGFAADGKFSAETAEKLSVQSVNKTPITYGSESYRGYFFLDRGVGENITVINIVAMNQYLYGVVGKEMSASFPTEALKAQAVCAKNFALGETDRHSEYGFDVCATTHCQVYSGVGGEAESIIAAVDAIGDTAAWYGGKIVPLYFFATSGGKTENAENVWGMEVPYLVSVDDPYEPADKASRYVWSTTLTGAELGSRLAAKGYDIGTVTSVAIEETSASGRVTKLTLTGTGGSKTLTREACRTVIGTDKLYSQCFTVSGDGSSSGAVATGGALGGGQVLTADGILPMAGKSVLSADGISEISSAAAEGGSFTFNGRGYGHGVGMSQWGAYGMAEAGYDYEQILKHYFTGIEIK